MEFTRIHAQAVANPAQARMRPEPARPAQAQAALPLQGGQAGLQAGTPTAEPEPTSAPAGPHQERASRKTATQARRAQLAREASQQILQARARALWGRDGPHRLAEQVSQLGKARHAQDLDAAFNGHDALERQVLLSALLLAQEEHDPLAQPAREMLAALELTERDTLRALRNVTLSLAPAAERTPETAGCLRRIYAACSRAAGSELHAAHAAALGLLNEFGAAGFERGLTTLRDAAHADLRARAPSRNAARMHTALSSTVTFNLVRDAVRFGDDCVTTLAARQVPLAEAPTLIGARLLKANGEGCAEAQDFLQRLLGQPAAAAVLASPWLLSQLHRHLSELNLTTWPQPQLPARLNLLESLLRPQVDDMPAQMVQSARVEALLRDQLSPA